MAKKEPYSRFKNASEQDRRLLDRLILDTKNPTNPDAANLNTSVIANVLKKSARDGSDIRNLFKVLPGLHLPREILISSIISPGDMATTSLYFSNTLRGVDDTLLANCDRVIRNFFVNTKKMEEKVYTWVDEARVLYGAHPIMILPEVVLDKMIRGVATTSSMESAESYGGEWLVDWYRPKGFLGVPRRAGKGVEYTSMESHRMGAEGSVKALHTIRGTFKGKERVLPIHITDNLMVFRKPAIEKMKRERGLSTAYGTPSFEAVRQRNTPPGSNSQIRSQFFKSPRRAQYSRIQVVPTATKDEILETGHPLEYHLPPECVVPIHVPGDESVHTHFLVALDQNGYPLSYVSKADYYDQVRQYMTNNGSESQAAGDVILMAKEAMAGNIADVSIDQIDRLAKMHTQIVESDIIDRLRTGMQGGEFAFNIPDQVNRMMFARSLSNKHTTLVLVPADYVIYMAYEYNEYGVGKSLLDDAKGLAAMAAAVQVANVLGSVQNAIPGKDINITLDPDSRTPQEDAIYMSSEAIGLAYRQFPSTVGSTAGLAEQLQLSAFNINIEGNPRFPEIKTSITPRESTKVELDPQIQAELMEDLYKIFGVTSEMVGGVNQPEFATTAVSNNLLLLKRVMTDQRLTNPFLTDYVRIYTYHSGTLIQQLLDVIDTYKKKIQGYDDKMEFIYDYISSITCSLPEPQTENLKKQAEQVDQLTEQIDKILDAYLQEEYFAGFNDPMIDKVYPIYRAGFKGAMLRRYMRKYGIFRDLDIFGTTEEGTPLMDLHQEMENHAKILQQAIGKPTAELGLWIDRNAKRLYEMREAMAKGEAAMADGPEPAPDEDFGLSAPPDDPDDRPEELSDDEPPLEEDEEPAESGDDDLDLSEDDLGLSDPPPDEDPPV